MEDVAAYAGVALKTVSRVVNDEPGVTPSTAERVRAAIDQLGFRRNDSARILRKGQTASIGLVMEDIGDPFYSSCRALSRMLPAATGTCCSSGRATRTRRGSGIALALCARRVDGLIVIPASDDHAYLSRRSPLGSRPSSWTAPPGYRGDTVLTTTRAAPGRASPT